MAASMSTVMEQLEGRIDATVDIGVHCGSRPMLVAAVSHFTKLDADLEVLGSGPNMRLTEDEVNALWSQLCVAVDSLVLHVAFSVACNPPDSMGE
jgi:hypothetical protein